MRARPDSGDSMGHKCCYRTAATGYSREDKQDTGQSRTGGPYSRFETDREERTEWPDHNIMERTIRTGYPRRNLQERTAGTGNPGKDKEEIMARTNSKTG